MGEMENTLVIVTSDNGPSSLQRYYQKGHMAPGSTNHLRGRKFSLYEGGIRQPMIFYWKGHTKAGYRDDKTVAQGVDLLPTIASIAGQSAPRSSEGVDLSPVFSGRTLPSRPPLFWAYGTQGAPKQPSVPHQEADVSPRYSIRDGSWKLLADADGANVELYQLENDPGETTSVADARPYVRDRLLRELRNWMAKLPKYQAYGLK
jgi:arylsulfatase A-like enzyme